LPPLSQVENFRSKWPELKAKYGVVHGVVPSAGKGPRVGHLDSLTGILAEMGCVYREIRQGQTPIGDGTRLIYSLRCMRDVIETIALERIEDRLDQMEGASHGNATDHQPHFRAH
jgi:hypothetical protein